MRKNTMLEIIQAARKLFTEHGYNNVSTQSIADAVGISKGNLNYHFKRKEDIMEAVVEEMHSHYTKPELPTTLGEMNALFMRVQKVVQENAFYYWHYTQLAQISKRIREIQNKVIRNNYTLFSEAFRLLNEDGVLQDEEYPEQYKQVIKIVMLTCTYWTPHSRFEEDMGTKRNFQDCIWAIIYPLLTDKGKEQYRDLKNPLPQGILNSDILDTE